jgi:hypothetical protein
MALSAGTTGAAEKTETPATMQPAKATKRTKTPVEVFNGSSSKLAKLGGLIDYVGERIEASDFVVVLGSGSPGMPGGEIAPTQFEVIRSVYRMSRNDAKMSLRRLFLYFLMRYDDFSIEESQMTTDSSSGIRVRFASDASSSDSDDDGV